MKRKIYLASSWRNPYYAAALAALRKEKHEVYDFKNPSNSLMGFSWTQTSSLPAADWKPETLLQALKHPVARRGYQADLSGMKWADTFVLLLPCGRSAHLEAGWATGQGKNVHVVLHKDNFKPELMYLLADEIHTSIADCITALI